MAPQTQVTELKRSKAEILEALKRAHEELSAAAELNMVHKAGGQVLNRLLSLLACVSFGHQKAHISKAVDELVEELQRDERPAAMVPLDVIEEALRRRAAAATRLRQHQETLEDQILVMRERSATLEGMLKHSVGDTVKIRKEKTALDRQLAGLQAQVTRLSAAHSVDAAEVGLLHRYQSMRNLIENGLPTGILEWTLDEALK